MSSSPRYVTSTVSAGHVLSGRDLSDIRVFVEKDGELAACNLETDARAYIQPGGYAVDINVYNDGYISGGGGAILSHDTIHAGGFQVEANSAYPEQTTADAIDTVILSGGVEDVESLGLSTSAVVEAGGIQITGEGVASATTVLGRRAGEGVCSFSSAARRKR